MRTHHVIFSKFTSEINKMSKSGIRVTEISLYNGISSIHRVNVLIYIQYASCSICGSWTNTCSVYVDYAALKQFDSGLNFVFLNMVPRGTSFVTVHRTVFKV